MVQRTRNIVIIPINMKFSFPSLLYWNIPSVLENDGKGRIINNSHIVDYNNFHNNMDKVDTFKES